LSNLGALGRKCRYNGIVTR